MSDREECQSRQSQETWPRRHAGGPSRYTLYICNGGCRWGKERKLLRTRRYALLENCYSDVHHLCIHSIYLAFLPLSISVCTLQLKIVLSISIHLLGPGIKSLEEGNIAYLEEVAVGVAK